MTETPQTTPRPQPVFMPPQSPIGVAPAATPAPPPAKIPSSATGTEETMPNRPKKPTFGLPKLRLEIRDLNHAGTDSFLESVLASKALQKAVEDVLTLLYETPDCQTTTVPPTRSVTLVLRSMGGVAYTTGMELDDDHKEIHFSLDYIHNSISKDRKTDEIMGVLTHEMVHCYQYNAFGTCPGGLIEGIADWVRLNANLSPPHWKRDASGKWDAGYQHTGYFLDYLESRFGKGTVRRFNEKLRIEKYDEKKFWTGLCGAPVDQLWADYKQFLQKEKNGDDEECVLVKREDAEDSGSEPTPTIEAAEDKS